MKAFLSIPVQGHRREEILYRTIAEVVRECGYEVANPTVFLPPAPGTLGDYDPIEIHNDLLERLADASLLIAEVSSPSLGVGYELALALKSAVPVICVCDKICAPDLSLMIRGGVAGRAMILEYGNPEELFSLTKQAIVSMRM